MNNYVIFTDSSSDLTKDMLDKRGIYSAPLSFKFDNEQVISNDEMPIKEFYSRMRNGSVAKTSAVNPNRFVTRFEDALRRGQDILYIGFSSGLSTTYNSARLAANHLKNKYPERKIVTVDSLCASCGIALLIDLVIKKKNEGASIDDAAKYAEDMKLKICHWFTVDDLAYLKRGGRINPTAAFFGNMLGIKPILHVDNDGHLVPVGKIRGRRLSIEKLGEKYELLRDENAPEKVYISHADCQEEAERLSTLIRNRYGAETALISHIGPVIGAHSGPGTIALFFVGKER